MNDRFKFRVWDGSIMILDTGMPHSEFIQGQPLIYMQCTGLKDKNGKLIYEGDIVKGEFGNVEEVIWMNKIDDEFEWSGFGLDYHVEESEIIGNIYENPELLTKTND